MTREVVYERNVTGSYMKVPMALDSQLDEKILLRKKLPGLLTMEKIYINQGAWYWYNISGKQSLEHYCRITTLKAEILEQIIYGICREIEVLRQNYLSEECLVLDSEYIFISNQSQEIIFMAYPGNSTPLQKGLQLLMEYLLTKIEHKDMAAVKKAYSIYEKTLNEAYTLEEIRDSIIAEKAEEHCEKNKEFYSTPETAESKNQYQKLGQQKNVSEKTMVQKILPVKESAMEEEKADIKTLVQKKITELLNQFQEWKSRFFRVDLLKKKKEDIQEEASGKKSKTIIICPEEEYDENKDTVRETIHPTICLSDYREHPRGILLYEGTENFNNISLNASDQLIGKSKDVSVCIEKDTISSLHAGIWFEEEEYYLEDYNSTNGTFVNNEPLAYKEKRKLECNDIVRFADVKYRFV